VDGELLTAVYGYEGDAMTSGILTFPYSVYEGSIQLLSPYDGDSTVSLASPEIIALWNTPMKVIESGKYPFKRGESCLPVPAELTWSDAAGGSKTYTVTVSKSLDLSDPIVLTSDECKAYVYDLEIGRKYYWQVTDGNTASQIYTFTTEFYPRFFALEGISNFRDVGGYVTRDGRRVKQSMMFRSASLNGVTPEAKDYMVNTLGLKLELDIRGSGSAIFGKEVPRKVIAMQWYTHIFSPSNSEVVRQTISAFADPAHYPMNFHCSLGRDRTGTTAFLILGLLGVDEETLLREYYASFLSRDGACDRDEFVLHIENIHSLLDRLHDYSPQGTLQEQIESYLLSVGVTEAEIASIREILLED
jgi:protein-tyrosine phosphatase